MKEIILSFFLYSLTGVLLHFTYNFFKKNKVVGIFSSVNESIWEHIKLLLTPVLFFNTIKNIISNQNNYFTALFVELFLSIVLIIIFYRIKVAIFKDKYDFINIIIFFTTALIVSISGYYIKNINISLTINHVCAFLDLVIFMMYLSFTIFPPNNELFIDPIDGTYGYNDVK